MHRNTIRAHKLKAELIEQLGSKCELCPATKDLQFDHREGSDWVLNRLSFLQRMNLYVREVAEKKIRLLCGPCNLKVRVPGQVKAWQKTNHAGVPSDLIPF